MPAYTAKVNAKFPAAIPALRGVICLHDLATGALLALLDSSTVTAWRTGLAAALVTDRLARAGGTVGFVGAGVAGADAVVVATWATEPVLHSGDIGAGQHVTSLGADDPTKRELDTDLIHRALLVVDDRDLAASQGVVASVVRAGGAPPEIGASTGGIWRGEHPGRTSATEVTVHSPVGLPWQDLSLAWLAYTRAQTMALGTEIDLLT